MALDTKRHPLSPARRGEARSGARIGRADDPDGWKRRCGSHADAEVLRLATKPLYSALASSPSLTPPCKDDCGVENEEAPDTHAVRGFVSCKGAQFTPPHAVAASSRLPASGSPRDLRSRKSHGLCAAAR